ncbi:ABC transporter ATP-binding protein [Weizmannia acidilactici]|uniref:ABC transporter ATP-binding protein n=1 Tax=Weizmannia acidilactici TaxID=2607726 RepID=UPI00124C4B8F|nr:ABC transporter ATP-binding protein [Weizmannia acidilactici]GER74902.1 multidrug ABC transporter permease [Weizmannia acidilactici]
MAAKRLIQYALTFKGIIITALAALMVAVGADVLSPIVSKNMIDHHITGIESEWVETAKSPQAVAYGSRYYKRLAYASEEEKKGKKVSIVQVGKNFYFAEGKVETDGKHSIRNGKVYVTYNGKTTTYPAVRLSYSEVLRFYSPEVPYIINLLVLYFALYIVSGLGQFAQYFYLQKAANRIIQKMRNDVFSHLQKLPIQFFDNSPAGKIVSRITNDTEAIHELYVAVLSNFFSGAIYIIGIYIAMFLLDWRLAMICTVLIPVLFIWMRGYRKFAQKYNYMIRSKVSEMNAMINESIQGMPVIQAFRREKQTKNAFEKLNGTHFRYQKKLLVLNSLSSHNLTGILKNLVLVSFLWYFGHDAASGLVSGLSVGLLYAYVDYINRLFNPISNIVNQFGNLEQAIVSGERVFKLLGEKGEDVSSEAVPRFKGHVVFDHVYFAYKENEYVLKDIDFEAKPGETVALVGHTGSGKSSIMNVLFRFYDCTKGEIRIDGTDIRSLPRQTVREHMAIVLQDPYLFTGTIYSNVSLGDPRITREKAAAVLKAVGADKVLGNLEKGLDEPVIEKGSTLSSGQRQLISFARALAFDPAILILDEATSNIDTETETLIQEAMDVLKKGRTTFIIAHRLSTIKNADQILVLDRGRIVERGNHEELMGRKGKYYQMYQMQHGNRAEEAG